MADIKVTITTMAVKAIEEIKDEKNWPRVLDASHRGCVVLNGHILPFHAAE